MSGERHRIVVGDCLESLRGMASESVNCCVTSPPYFGLRDYGMDGQIGLEHSPDQYVSSLVAVFRDVLRVLRDDGTLWLNIGDSYASTAPGTRNAPQTKGSKTSATQWANFRPDLRSYGIKPKDMIGIPWRLAFALQADGWYLRQDIIWHKPNVMPQSVRDRCTSSYEHLFLLSKSQNYHFDAAAMREPSRDGCLRNRRDVWSINTSGFKGAHFATFPTELIRPCIQAGCPVDGLVLDPFGGSGTTGVVAMQERRRSLLCEINPEYAEMARKRIDAAWLDGAAQMDILRDQPAA